MSRSAQSNDIDLRSLSVDELIALDAKILELIKSKRQSLQAKIAMIELHMGPLPEGPRKRGVKKGTKLAAKYKGPNGETWSGRGLQPKWLTALVGRSGSVEKYRLR